MLSLQLVLKGVVTMPVLAGLGMLAMGLGAIEVDPKMAAVASVYADPLGLPLLPFIAAGGFTKVTAALALWGLVPALSKDLACLGLAVPAALAVYGHWVAEGPEAAVPPAIYLCLLGAYYFMSSSSTTTNDKNKKN